jgi:multicomponent Na+:H+ antiporter subunit G
MEVFLDILSWVSVLAGIFFMVVGTFGIIRMPDVYTRLHAAGMTDTMGAGFLLLAMCFQVEPGLTTVRLIIVYGFLLFTSPIGTHALAHAALVGGVKPLSADMKGEES